MKKGSINFSPAALKNSLFRFLRRFHLVLFVTVVFGGLAVSVFVLNLIVVRSSDPTTQSAPTINATFDQAIIQRIEELKTRDQSSTEIDLSKGRTNPFVE